MGESHDRGSTPLLFGDFVLDVASSELRKGADRVPLKPQPLKLLHMLASSGGAVVSREEIQKSLWPSETFVDYDTGINSCVRQIRRALDDDAESPRYIETLPRRGYRFVPSVQRREGSKTSVALRPAFLLRVLVAGTAVCSLGWVLWKDVNPPEPRELQLTDPLRLSSAEGVESFPTWSPDGRLLAYTTQNDAMIASRTDVWVVPVAGGEALNRTRDHEGINNFASWLPNGSGLTFRSDREGPGIYTMPALAGPVRKLLDVGDVTVRTAPALWSRDGRRVALSSADDEGPYVEIVTPETGHARRIPMPTGGYYFDLTWSPDETLLSYVQASNRRDDTTSLWVVRMSDSESFQLTERETNEWSPTWAPDSRTLYFVSNAAGASDLWYQKLDDGGAPMGNTEAVTAGMEIRQAALSPGGDKVALVRGTWVSNLWRAPILPERPATWADAEQVTFDRDFIRQVAVTTDGTRVAVVSNRQGSNNVWLVDDEGALKRFTEKGLTGSSIDWSSTGESLLYTGGDDRDLWVTDGNGGARTRVTRHEASDSAGRWSSDDRHVIFTSVRSGRADLWIKAVDGGEPRKVTHHTGFAAFGKPDWTPDGKSISSVIYRPATGPRLETIPIDGGLSTPISPHPIWNYLWTASGDIYFTALSGPLMGNVWADSQDGSDLRALTEFDGKPGTLGGRALATDGKYLYFTWEEDEGDIWLMNVSGE